MVHNIPLEDLRSIPELPSIETYVYFWDWNGNIHDGKYIKHLGIFVDSNYFSDLNSDNDIKNVFAILDVSCWKYKI